MESGFGRMIPPETDGSEKAGTGPSSTPSCSQAVSQWLSFPQAGARANDLPQFSATSCSYPRKYKGFAKFTNPLTNGWCSQVKYVLNIVNNITPEVNSGQPHGRTCYANNGVRRDSFPSASAICFKIFYPFLS